MNKENKLNFGWLLKMAWRDSRKNRSRLFLFVSSIILGIAALVAIYSLGYTIEKDVDAQAKTLVGADLVFDNNQPFSAGAQALMDSLGEDRARERSFASMIYFTKTGGTRLAQVRALDGGFPFYGSIETIPARAAKTFQQGRQALVDKTLMLQFRASVGDSIRVGELSFIIAGEIIKAPGKTGFSTAMAPAVWIPMQYLDATGLLQKGSRITYTQYVQFSRPVNMDKLMANIEPRLETEGIDIETVETRKQTTGRAFGDLNEFLQLVSFIALLLGCIGVASSIHIYIREKLASISMLKCLGATNRQAFLIYLLQIAGIGLIGSLVGALAGTGIQFLLPSLLQDFLPIDINMQVSWRAIAQGIAVGLMVSVLFALLPLIGIRNISPLNTLRITDNNSRMFRDPLQWLVGALIILFILGFSWLQLGNFFQALIFTVSVIGSFLLLAGVAMLMMWLARRFFPSSWSYLWRQGFANLFRPNNQTVILVVAIGLGTSFICLLYFVQDILTRKVELSASENQPNMVIFDIQDAQKNQVADLTRTFQLPVIQQVPIITMRIEEIKGINATMARNDSTLDISPHAFEGEIRATYRDTLTDSEKLTEGILQPAGGKRDSILVSLEEGYARRLHVKPGDKIVFNVQGALIPAFVGSFREVDWNRVQTNFRVVFPSGVLESAPKFHVLVTRVPSNEVSAKFQRSLVSSFPTVSVIDLGLILTVVDDILDKIGFVVRFIGGFSIVTGLVVLIASIIISKYQRIRESVLLRTLGGTGKQILVITALEYFFLGSLAALTGILLALAGGWALAVFSFKTSFAPAPLPVLVIFLGICCITVLIGLFNSRDILNRPPLEVLRNDL
ncbi:ABC transporter permease [Flavihumibacter stibioxidans]|uniref:ABC transporter permease n=1 Tax=Flavihumibacter stibioxidans TaxID=1834163 RepID=A0ABR7MBW1_9BACT|nr:FtsX-like permease family protein [Flavihumibacter stibioxidans]MBC6492111.1 ABC transporter permease [Flavihumibacter stibioxidans]